MTEEHEEQEHRLIEQPYENAIRFITELSKWGRTWGLSLTKESAMLGISPGDTIEVTVRVITRQGESVLAPTGVRNPDVMDKYHDDSLRETDYETDYDSED